MPDLQPHSGPGRRWKRAKNPQDIELSITPAVAPGADDPDPKPTGVRVLAPDASSSSANGRNNAQESAAIANLRTINTAEVTYLSAAGGEYGTMQNLIEAGLLDSRFSSGFSGYKFSILLIGTGDYIAAAAPTSPETGNHAFYSTPDGVVRFAVDERLAPPALAGQPVQ